MFHTNPVTSINENNGNQLTDKHQVSKTVTADGTKQPA